MGRKIFAVLLLLLLIFSLFAGCSSGSAVEFEVENVEKTGKNLYPLKQQVLNDVKENIDIWINNPEKIEQAFTGAALSDFKAARQLDRKEGVKRVRVHKKQEFKVIDLHDGKRPEVEYKFLDLSYFVDAKTGKPKTKPYNKERRLTIFLVLEGNRWKINSMVGSTDAIR